MNVFKLNYITARAAFDTYEGADESVLDALLDEVDAAQDALIQWSFDKIKNLPQYKAALPQLASLFENINRFDVRRKLTDLALKLKD